MTNDELLIENDANIQSNEDLNQISETTPQIITTIIQDSITNVSVTKVFVTHIKLLNGSNLIDQDFKLI